MKIQTIVHFAYLGILFSLANIPVTQAQIIPDDTLPNNSAINSQGNIIQIEGGTTRGNNLFHSFEAFSIPPNVTASFNNSTQIQHIFSRVTGNSISNFEGILETQGTADLFLLNPNGIIFGENATINIGGSFFATTAETILFQDNTQFSAVPGDSLPLLTISAPRGLNLGTNPGDIINRSFAFDEGLIIQPGNTINLIGGNISIEGGVITAPGGRVELGAVSANNNLSLISDELGWKVDYQNVTEFQNINFDFAFISSDSFLSDLPIGGEFIFAGKDLIFTNESLIAVASDFGGNIEIRGSNVVIDSGSQILANTFSGEAATINIKSSESILVEGSSFIFNEVLESASATQKQALSIESKNLILRSGGQIGTGTFGSGKGVDLQIDVTESITIEGVDGESEVPSGLLAEVAIGDIPSIPTTGNAGNLTINTSNLIVRDGGQISGSTASQGNAAEINIIANSIFLEGRNSLTNSPSGIFSQVRNTANTEKLGNAGKINISTNQLSIINGARINAIARNSGNGGEISISSSEAIRISGTSEFGQLATSFGGIVATSQSESTSNVGSIEIQTIELIVEKGGVVAANNRGTGDGGSTVINSESLIVREGGQIGNGSLVFGAAIPIEEVTTERGTGGTLTINASKFVEVIGKTTVRDEVRNSSLFTRAEGTGNAGNLNIFTPKLTVAEAGNIDVSATGTGEAGSLNINVQDITLDNASLTAETRTGDRGNITIDKADTLLLRNNSEITTNATEQATGGDITITSALIVLQNNSNITANAIEGRGGNILITTQGLFQDLDSNITAASELGIDGTISINTPDVDPASGLVELPDVPVDVSALLARNICDIGRGKTGNNSSFINTGRGGLPPNPYEPLESNNIFVDVQLPTEWRKKPTTNSSVSQPATKPIVEASTWVINEKGNVELVSQVSSISRCSSKSVDGD